MTSRVTVLSFPCRGVVVSLVAATMALLAVGCGRRGVLLGTVDGAGDAAAPSGDAAGSRFSPPQLVSALSAPPANSGDPTFTGDLLELFFMSDRNGSPDLWTSRRAAAGDPWGPPTVVAELNSLSSDSGPSISLDGLRIWFTTDRDLSFGRIWRSSRATRQDFWSPPQIVSELATPAKDFAPTIDATETTMMFGSNRMGSLSYDVHVTTRAAATGPWGAVSKVPGVNGPFDDWDPFVAQGGLVIFFTSVRQGAGDIFWAVRQSTTEPFPPATALVDINSAAYDSDATLSPDLTYMLFDSRRTGNSEIYETHAVR